MTLGAGLVRSEATLRDARAVAEHIVQRTDDEGLRLAATTASLVCRAAEERNESRGVHFRTDHPEREPGWEGRHVRFKGF